MAEKIERVPKKAESLVLTIVKANKRLWSSGCRVSTEGVERGVLSGPAPTALIKTDTPSQAALSIALDKALYHMVTLHLGMSSGFLPEPALGPRFLLSLGLTMAQRLAYYSRFFALPTTSFLVRSCYSTFGA